MGKSLIVVRSNTEPEQSLDSSRIQAWRSGAAGGEKNQVSPLQLDRSDSPFCCGAAPSADFEPPFSKDQLALLWDGPYRRSLFHLFQKILSPSPSVLTYELH